MKHPYTGSTSPIPGINREDFIGLAIIAFIGILGLSILFSNPLLFKGSHAANEISQPTKHLSAAALNSEKTAKADFKKTLATRSSENTKM